MRCHYETEACKKNVHCTTCPHYVVPEINTTKLYQTNADYIRSLTNEELAEWLVYKIRCSVCDAANCNEKFCINLIKRWLECSYGD